MNVLRLAAVFAGVSIGLITWLIAKQLISVKFEKKQYHIRTPLMFKILLPFARRLKNVARNDTFKGWLERADERLIMAGATQLFTPEEFVGLRILYGIVMSIIGAVLMISSTKIIVIMGLMFIGLAWGYPDHLWLGSIIRKRHRAIQRALPNVLDLLTLSVEAGRDFLTALRDILRNREKDPLGEELEQVFREVQLGKQRRFALQAMANRVRQADLDTVVETLVQADQLGVSIGHILRVLGDQMRQKRFAYAEKLANEAPVKMLFPLFIFIFPAVLIIMLGPILLKALSLHAL
jgi:tight adherence protein C